MGNAGDSHLRFIYRIEVYFDTTTGDKNESAHLDYTYDTWQYLVSGICVVGISAAAFI